MIYMDADIQVFDNIDHLFDLPIGCFYGVVDCLCIMYGQPCAQKLQWPQELGREPSFYLNGGMFVFEPNLNTYNELMSTLKVTPPTPFAEQVIETQALTVNSVLYICSHARFLGVDCYVCND